MSSDLYFCPAVCEVESASHGGFKICCAHPERHIPMPDSPATAAVSVALSQAAKRQYTLEQHVHLLRVALAARGGDHLLTGLDMGAVESGPVQSILLTHSAVTRHAEMTLTQPNGVIVTWEMPTVKLAQVKAALATPEGPLAARRMPFLVSPRRTVTITLEL